MKRVGEVSCVLLSTNTSRSSLPFSIKFDRTLSYHQREVKFEFEKNRIVKTQTAAKNMLNEVLKSVSRRLKEFVCK